MTGHKYNGDIKEEMGVRDVMQEQKSIKNV
jgi:hypothetical protein